MVKHSDVLTYAAVKEKGEQKGPRKSPFCAFVIHKTGPDKIINISDVTEARVESIGKKIEKDGHCCIPMAHLTNSALAELAKHFQVDFKDEVIIFSLKPNETKH